MPWRRYSAKLLILDNLSSLVRSGEGNDVDSWQPVQDFLLWLRRKGVSVLSIHHSDKGGQSEAPAGARTYFRTASSARRRRTWA